MQPDTPRCIQIYRQAKDHDIKFYCLNDIKSKIKILDNKHAEGTVKNSQDNKVLRLESSGRTLYELRATLLYDVGSAGYAYLFHDARKINRDDLRTHGAVAFGVRLEVVLADGSQAGDDRAWGTVKNV
nr:hypothetical protein [Tanacetum cinerariifolium]